MMVGWEVKLTPWKISWRSGKFVTIWRLRKLVKTLAHKRESWFGNVDSPLRAFGAMYFYVKVLGNGNTLETWWTTKTKKVEHSDYCRMFLFEERKHLQSTIQSLTERAKKSEIAQVEVSYYLWYFKSSQKKWLMWMRHKNRLFRYNSWNFLEKNKVMFHLSSWIQVIEAGDHFGQDVSSHPQKEYVYKYDYWGGNDRSFREPESMWCKRENADEQSTCLKKFLDSA